MMQPLYEKDLLQDNSRHALETCLLKIRYSNPLEFTW
jgi:hypothetical protein